ncbi:hypothetical protein KY319_03160 [Candidatus Woesearchaeota archaeon]|nr:hypothetical protein [Candidatus Woesearchaeota archaeon]
MEFTQESYDQLIQDVKTVLLTLRENSQTDQRIKNCLVANINTLFQYTYNIYHSHAKELGANEIREYEKQYAQAVNMLQSFERYGLNEGSEDIQNEPYWHFYFTFIDPDLQKCQEMVDKCNIRIYVNPKIKCFAEAITEIVKNYYAITERKRGLLYFKFPKRADLQTINRADKIVLYLSEDSLKFMEARLRWLSERGLFEDATPFFTHKIAPGVSESRNPSERLIEKIPILWKKMFKREYDSTSFGHFMTLAILGALQSNLIGRKLRTMTDRLALDEIPLPEFNPLTDYIARNFVAPRAAQIITGKPLKALGIAA